MRSINTLPDILAARIAAGEVIERPESVLRELMDNAVDSGADEILCYLENGGIDRISVIDNGDGISREDLEVIASRHATSKIRTQEDLYNIHTLGFRGEALYSIASVSRLSIRTHRRETGEESTLVIDNGRREDIQPSGTARGTSVTVEDLFFDIPARRAFLKRPQSEASACRNLFISKALAFPGISFKLYIDGALKISYEKCDSLKERVMMLYRPLAIPDADTMYLKANGEDYSISIIAAKSDVHRNDRKEVRIYVNNRAVDEYSLQQAVVYGYGEMLPGGSYPYACVFLDICPELVDFNIHPAKREVKLRNQKEVHHALASLLRNGLERVIPEIKAEQEEPGLPFKEERRQQARTYLESLPSYGSGASYIPKDFTKGSSLFREDRTAYSLKEEKRPVDDSWLEKAKELKRKRDEEELRRRTTEEEKIEEEEERKFRYVGQVFNLFLLAEKDDQLYLIDQHAAHERIIYDELVSKSTVQNLLFPIELEVEKETDDFLMDHTYIYTNLGIMLQRVGDLKYEIVALPAIARSMEKEIIDFITGEKGDAKELETQLFAIIACRSAIKKGDKVDSWAAESIIEKVFAMPEPCCPHGRTFLVKLKKSELELMVGRT